MTSARHLVAALAAIAAVYPATSALADRPDRPPVSSLLFTNEMTGIGYIFNASTNGGTQIASILSCVASNPNNDGYVQVYGALDDPDSVLHKSNALSAKQSAYLNMQIFFCDNVGACTNTSQVKVQGCAASWKITDVNKNLDFTDDNENKGSGKLACEESLVTPLALDAQQQSDLAASFPEGVSCKFLGWPHFGCFRGDTKVATEAGLRSIRDIRVGDRVWSWDDAQKKKVLSRVTQTFALPARELRTLVAAGETFHVTDGHPFWVDGRGWTEAAKIAKDDKVRTSEGDLALVRSNERADFLSFYSGYDASADRQTALKHPLFQFQQASLGMTTAESGLVFNIEVAGVHNYYVGDGQILVHNK